MSWFGKVIGGSLGMMIFGPLGAILGAAIGHQFDEKENKEEVYGKTDYFSGELNQGEKAQMMFFVTTFTILGKMAYADGKFSSQEISSFNKILNETFNISGKQADLAYKIFIEAQSEQYQYEEILEQFNRLFYNDEEMRLLILELMIKLAMADNIFHKLEQDLLNKARQTFRITDIDYDNLLKKYMSFSVSEEKHYAVLGCKKTDSIDDIKSKYRKLVIEFHPDKVIAKGMPDEFVKFAQDKFREIQDAYEQIKKERNFV